MKTLKRNVLPFVVLIGCFACGSQAPNIGDDFCPEEEVNASSTNVAQSSSAVGVGGASNVSSSAASTSTGAGGGDVEQKFDTPAPDEIVSRLHSCHKLSYQQLGNFLRSRGASIPPGNVSDIRTTQISIFGSSQMLGTLFGGSGAACEMAVTTANGTNDPVCGGGEVCFCNQDDKMNQVNRSCLDVGNNSPDAADGYCVSKPATPGFLYFTGKDALGVPKLDSRLGEKEEHSTASAMKLMDIFVQAAPQIIANIGDPSRAPACTLNGKNMPMFSSDGNCVEESVSCLIGTPATEDHMLLCNLLVSKADKNSPTDVMKKRNIAVAVLMSAAHSCQ